MKKTLLFLTLLFMFIACREDIETLNSRETGEIEPIENLNIQIGQRPNCFLIHHKVCRFLIIQFQ